MTQEEEIRQLREENNVLRAANQVLQQEVIALRQRITQLEALLKEALDQLNKNSTNSSKPPSSDRFHKTKSLRTPTNKKPGGQPGHPGTTLPMSANPDVLVLHEVQQCSQCHKDLSSVAAHAYESRQVYDLPPALKIMITEHRCAVKTCPHCAAVNKGHFPAGVAQRTQYGAGLQALGVYLTQYQLLPFERCAQLLEDLLGHRPSEGWLVNTAERCAAALPPFEAVLKQGLRQSGVLFVDETGYYFEHKSMWLHVAATPELTYYCAHEKRGSEALEAMDILPRYEGVAMHDYWSAYLDYECGHVFCHAHHLRDLNHCIEAEKSQWAAAMKAFLLRMKQSVEEERSRGGWCLSAEEFGGYHQQYVALMEQGEREHPLPLKQQGVRGRVKKSKSRNLVERFVKHAAEMLRFGCDFSIPFSNNVAEQALRMMKVKQKISGCFRSKAGAESFALIRSYIDTVRKQGCSIWESLKQAMVGSPWMPLVPAPA